MSAVPSLLLAECNIGAIERLDIYVDISDDPSPEELNEWVATLFNQMFTPALLIKASQVSAHRLDGGMTNCLYVITINHATTVQSEKQQDETTQIPYKYLLRIYGTGADEFLSRDKELHWLKQLALCRIGPQVYGIFGNGRLEEFLESTTLTEDDVSNASTSRQIAQRLCELHTKVGHHSPLSVEGGKQNSEAAAACLSGEPALWANIGAWMELIHRKWPEIRRKCDGNVECADILDNWHR
ncbi:hypothetical protein GGI22_006305, partial [Coemansia erecta]